MNNAFTKYNSVILSGRKASNVRSIIYSLSLSSPCTTRDIAKISLQNETISNASIKDNESRIREQIYYKLITGRMYKKSGRKKGERYPGLIENGYVVDTGKIINEKNKLVKKFTLTFRGLFFALGFNFDVSMIEIFLKNNSKNNLLCAYLNLVLKNTSPKFIQDVFLHPIYSIIVNNKILLDGDLGFYFINISQAIGNSAYVKTSQINQKYLDTNDYEKHMMEVNNLIDITENLMNKTFFDLREFNAWDESIAEYFYKSELDLEFYKKYSHERDSRLLYEIIKSVYNAFYFAMEFEIPKPRNKLPLAKGLQDHRRYKKKVGIANKKELERKIGF